MFVTVLHWTSILSSHPAAFPSIIFPNHNQWLPRSSCLSHFPQQPLSFSSRVWTIQISPPSLLSPWGDQRVTVRLPPGETFPAPPPGWAELWAARPEAGLGRLGFWGNLGKRCLQQHCIQWRSQIPFVLVSVVSPQFGTWPHILESHCSHWGSVSQEQRRGERSWPWERFPGTELTLLASVEREVALQEGGSSAKEAEGGARRWPIRRRGLAGLPLRAPERAAHSGKLGAWVAGPGGRAAAATARAAGLGAAPQCSERPPGHGPGALPALRDTPRAAGGHLAVPEEAASRQKLPHLRPLSPCSAAGLVPVPIGLSPPNFS